jgi:hypothetical protein
LSDVEKSYIIHGAFAPIIYTVEIGNCLLRFVSWVAARWRGERWEGRAARLIRRAGELEAARRAAVDERREAQLARGREELA